MPDESRAAAWMHHVAENPGSVLLQRAARGRAPGHATLFRDPVEVIEAFAPHEVRAAFERLEQRLAEGFYLAGYVAYEAGFAMEPSLVELAVTLADGSPLLWFGCYGEPAMQDIGGESDLLLQTGGIAPRFAPAREAYERAVEAVRERIAAGATYQANLTMEATWSNDEAPAALFRRLLAAQPVSYAAMLQPQSGWHVLSLSPELFFGRHGDEIVTRPMKGTAPTGMDIGEVRRNAAWLRADEKNRAENVMIVDLLRNDLGRICRMGTVEAPSLFDVERYPTVLQMTSTVRGRLREGVGYREIFAALFPSGSIVGAPKIETMRILHTLEGRARGVYTGAIGYMAPGGEAEFNVAIRTVSLRDGVARCGVGAGITYGSVPAQEYEECLTKAAFLTREPEPAFQLIETLRLQGGRFALLEEHLLRLRESAEYFGFGFEEETVRARLGAAAAAWTADGAARVRLLLDRAGQATCTMTALAAQGCEPVTLVLARERTDVADRFLRHKTTHREAYDAAHGAALAAGFADALFCNTLGEVTEAAIYNVLVRLDGRWYTPALASGVLPGVYRQQLLALGQVAERRIGLNELLQAEQVAICNSVRGVRAVEGLVQRAESGATETLWRSSRAVLELTQLLR